MSLPFDDAGSGPSVVLLHAGVADRTMWREHVQPLTTAGYRVLAVDLPGFGEAPVPDGEQAPWIEVLRTMDELAIDRAALVGNSFGGAVALRVAVLAPARVWGLALICAPAPWLDPSPELEVAWAAEEEALARGDVDAAVEAVLTAWTLPDAPPQLRERLAAMQRRAFAQQASAASESSEAADPVEEDPLALARLRIPALVAAGEHDMSDFRDGAELMAATLPLATAAVIAGAGHLPPLETPVAFRRLLLDFLARVTPDSV